jgi:hypothetical protein
MLLTVALIGDPDSPFTELAGDDWKTPYSDRRSTQVEVPGTASIAEVLEEAAERLGVQPPEGHHFATYSAAHSRLAFYRPEDERGTVRRVWELGELAVVDRRAKAVFGVHDNRAITVDQLIRTSEAGLLDGDPLRPYLIVEAPYGDAPPIDLATFKVALDVLWDVITVVSTVGGAVAFGKLVLDGVKNRVAAGRQALDAAWPDLPQRLTRPDQLWRVLLLRPWSTQEIADLLDCEQEVAEGLLLVSGFSPDETGRWTLATTDDCKLLYDLFTVMNRAEKLGSESFVGSIEVAAESLLRTGVVPEEALEEEEFFWGPGAARRTLARDAGEATDHTYLRAFCRRTRRPELDDILDATRDLTAFAVIHLGADRRPWEEVVLRDQNGERLTVSVDLDDGDPETLFAAEMAEFLEHLSFAEPPAKYDLLRFLFDVRMIVTVTLPCEASPEQLTQASVAIVQLIASQSDGIVFEELQRGWWLHGQLIARDDDE